MNVNRNNFPAEQYVWAVFFCMVTGSINAQSVKIKSDHIEINYDKDFNRDIKCLDVSDNALTYFDTDVQFGIVIDGIDCKSFSIDNKEVLVNLCPDAVFDRDSSHPQIDNHK